MRPHHVNVLLTLFILAASPVGAHEAGASNELIGTCLHNAHCHSMADVMGYDVFGLGIGGMVLGIVFWTAAVLTMLYLIDRVWNHIRPTSR